MKAEIGELQRSYGEIHLFPENSDDLWHLHHLINPGCLVFATTLRSVEGTQDKIRPEKQEKRPVRLGIRVEDVEFHEYSIRLRVFGVIESGVDTGSHHTLNLEPGFEISVIKAWSANDLERIERAVKGSNAEAIHILVIEEGEAELYRVHSFGPKQIWSLAAGSGKTAELSSREVFSETVISQISAITGPLVIAGPGFVKEEIIAKYRRNNPSRTAPLVIGDTRTGGRRAVQEIIGQGILEKLNGDLQLAREVTCLDELMRRIGKDEPVAYGSADVREAISCGAVQTLLVTDSLLREPEIAGIIRQAEEMRSEVVIFSSRFEPGERLSGLGGVAALLRYNIR
ncbi:mRNA surveillance protein pelota [Methanospirillum stamsii]|uniref:Protein pelota homolog n=1 Tax=Methanospirillum stamsii TaxID=1277351 RepID=A0A2V2N0I9_9EURY|nr:mRNA surveillance protein pelota [Methanospirillum stamsii]PWR70048.1 mRNA surveillance protein pelota [Methanospirillum stamsii]